MRDKKKYLIIEIELTSLFWTLILSVPAFLSGRAIRHWLDYRAEAKKVVEEAESHLCQDGEE